MSNPSIMGIAIIGEKYDVCFYDEITVSSQNSYCFPRETYGNGQKLKEITNNREIRYSSLEHLSSREYGADDVIYVSSPLESVDEGSTERPYGYIVICIKEEALRRVYEKSNTESNLTMVLLTTMGICCLFLPEMQRTSIFLKRLVCFLRMMFLRLRKQI